MKVYAIDCFRLIICCVDCKLISIISVKEKRKGRLGRGVLFQDDTEPRKAAIFL
jgi:hypothetical protein